MKAILQKMRADRLVGPVICIILGVVLMINPTGWMVAASRLMGTLLIIIGGFQAFVGSMDGVWNSYDTQAVCKLAFGIILVVFSKSSPKLLPFLIGLAIVVLGGFQVYQGLQNKKQGIPAKANLEKALIYFISGLAIMAFASFIIEVAMRVVAGALIVYGITMLISGGIKEKKRREIEQKKQPIDVEAREIE